MISNIDTRQFIAHRGWPAQCPENSLTGVQAAVRKGARNVEFDIQLSKDGVPVILHDASLSRTGNDDRRIFGIESAEIVTLANGEPARFSNTYASERVPTLQAMVATLVETDVTVFAEIKRQSIRHFGLEVCLDAVLPLLQPLHQRVVVLSFDAECVAQARDRGFARIGWAFEHWTMENLETAHSLKPDYLFCDVACLAPDTPLPRVTSRWAIYDIRTLPEAMHWIALGADLVETDFIGEFLDQLHVTSNNVSQ